MLVGFQQVEMGVAEMMDVAGDCEWWRVGNDYRQRTLRKINSD